MLTPIEQVPLDTLFSVGLLHNSCVPMHAESMCNKRVATLIV